MLSKYHTNISLLIYFYPQIIFNILALSKLKWTSVSGIGKVSSGEYLGYIITILIPLYAVGNIAPQFIID